MKASASSTERHPHRRRPQVRYHGRLRLMRIVLLLTLLAPFCAAAPVTDSGEINGAKYRIDIPGNWNRVLVVYCHGYSFTPGNLENPRELAAFEPFLAAGYAVARSAYAAGGFAVKEAVHDTQALRRHFTVKHGAPEETYVMGHSMGGLLTMALVEMFPEDYDGGLALCGVLSSSAWFVERHVFDSRVVFDYLFPGLLPPPGEPAPPGPETAKKLAAALEANTAAAETMRRYLRARDNQETAGATLFFTGILAELHRRAGGNAFDNRNTIYEGSGDDNALNDGVRRYAAVPRAVEYLRNWYTPTGRLLRPLLAIHTTQDAIVPPWTPNMYSTIATQAGSADLFVQQYVKRAGHCAITPEETVRGFSQLREWKTNGVRPQGGAAR
jgi:pimeloyl-ACP methyl ester carboxylesterase